MERFDFMFFSNGKCFEAHGDTLEQDRKEETEAGGDGEDIVAHVALTEENYEDDAGLEALVAIHRLALSHNGDSPLEQLLPEIFRAGMEYGRATANKKT